MRDRWPGHLNIFGSDRSPRSHNLRPSGPSLSRAVNLHLSRSESNQSIKIRVIQSEPKILRLVVMRCVAGAG